MAAVATDGAPHRRRRKALGGITGNGFKPGQSGNPGGRPKGLARTVRDVCGGSPLRLVAAGGDWAAAYPFADPKRDLPPMAGVWLEHGDCALSRGSAKGQSPTPLSQDSA